MTGLRQLSRPAAGSCGRHSCNTYPTQAKTLLQNLQVALPSDIRLGCSGLKLLDYFPARFQSVASGVCRMGEGDGGYPSYSCGGGGESSPRL